MIGHRSNGQTRRGALVVAVLWALASAIIPFPQTRTEASPAHVRWEPPAHVRDQGQGPDAGPDCVAMAWLNWLESAPAPNRAPISAWMLWRAAQVLDTIEGEDYDDGTTAEAGEQVLRNLGLVGQVEYTKDRARAIDFLLTTGPILVAGPWYGGGDDAGGPTSDHVARPTGRVRGWHLYECYAYDEGVTTCRNSWGAQWGDHGDFYAQNDWFSEAERYGWIDYVLPQKPAPLVMGSGALGQ